MLVLMGGTLMVAAPIMMVGGIVMAMREDIGLSWLVLARGAGARRLHRAHRQPDGAELPADAGAHRRGQPAAARADHRHPGGARVRPRAARDRRGSPTPTTSSPRSPIRAGRWQAAMFPTVMLVAERRHRRRALVRRAPGRGRPDGGRRADRLHLLPDADPHVGDDGDVHADDGPARRGVRRPDRRGPRHRVVGRRRRPTPVTELPERRRTSISTTVSFAYPGADEPVLRDVTFDGPARADGRDHRLDRRRQVDARQPGPAPLRRDRRARCASTASTYATSTRRCCGRGSGWCRRRPSSSRGTIADNLRYGKPDATDEEMWAALEIAQARDFVEAMPDGLEPEVAQGGTNVSAAGSGSGWRSRGR